MAQRKIFEDQLYADMGARRDHQRPLQIDRDIFDPFAHRDDQQGQQFRRRVRAEALQQLGREAFDLLITDLKMPRLDGMAVLQRVRAELPEMEAIVLTAHGTVETAVEAMRLGAFDYLEKPMGSPGQLRMVVARALERRALRTDRDRAQRERPVLPRVLHHMAAVRPERVLEAARALLARSSRAG